MNNSKKALQAAFREATFDPRKPSALTTIVTSNKVEYLTERANEMLRDSQRFSGAERRARIRDAVAILGYAMTVVPAEDLSRFERDMLHEANSSDIA